MNKFTDVMIDIETLSSSPNAAVIQIGACAFNLRTGEIGPIFQTLVRPDFKNTEASLSTICWWMGQNEAAREHVRQCEGGLSENAALSQFTTFFVTNTTEDACAWAMPPEFDLVILRNLGDAVGVKMPWHYAATRDLRTLEYLVGRTKEDRVKATVAHNAAEDAKAQALTAIKYYRSLNDYYPSHEALSDLVHLMSEEDALSGGGPGFSERWDKAKRTAFELFEP